MYEVLDTDSAVQILIQNCEIITKYSKNHARLCGVRQTPGSPHNTGVQLLRAAAMSYSAETSTRTKQAHDTSAATLTKME